MNRKKEIYKITGTLLGLSVRAERLGLTLTGGITVAMLLSAIAIDLEDVAEGTDIRTSSLGNIVEITRPKGDV